MQNCSKNDQNEFILRTSTGDLKGKCDYTEVFMNSQNKGGSVYSWLFVPYAEPPENLNHIAYYHSCYFSRICGRVVKIAFNPKS